MYQVFKAGTLSIGTILEFPNSRDVRRGGLRLTMAAKEQGICGEQPWRKSSMNPKLLAGDFPYSTTT